MDTVAGRTDRLGGVLHQRDVVGGADRSDPLSVSDRAVEVDRDHGGRPSAFTVPTGQLLVEEVGVEMPGERIAVDEARPGTQVGDREGARPEREAC